MEFSVEISESLYSGLEYNLPVMDSIGFALLLILICELLDALPRRNKDRG